MSEYRRFVSYLYEYRKGRKENNCGFVKVEIRNGACRIRLRLQPSGCADPLQVYGFVRDRQEILGIPLGTAQAQSGACEFQAGYPAAAVGGTSYSIRDVRGIWLQSADGQNYITVWDDEPVAAERFRVLPEKTAEREPARESALESAAEHTRAETETGAQETAAGQTHAETETGAQETAAGQTRAEAEADAQEAAAEQEQTDAQAVGAEQTCAEAETTAPEIAAEQEQTDAQAAGAEQICAETQAAAREHARAETQATAAEQVRNAGWDSGRSARPSGSLYQRWEQFLNHYPQVRPFADDEITQCIMIALKDLSFLQSGEWHFGRNTFVRQAYARYHHLLLGCHRSGRFVLAVPGTGRDPQEKQMARMYGFPYFKDSAEPQEEGCVRAADEQSSASDRQGSAVNGQGSPALTGYWYHFLNEACPSDL